MSSDPTDPISGIPPPDQAPEPGIPGKYVVLGMLTFGILATGFLWFYTYFSNKPYIPLRHALVQTFSRESSPQVHGGKERGRGPEKLRIVLTVKFDPSANTPQAKQQRDEMERQAIDVARQHLDLSVYERWEFILVQYVPEGTPHRWESKREMSEVR